MRVRSRFLEVLVLLMLASGIAWTAPIGAANLPQSEAVILVARPEFRDPIYGETILIARPIGQGQHLGFILNKPTKISLADAFPSHAPSRAVRGPLYFGGPAGMDSVFALVASQSSPGRGSMQLSPDLFLVIDAGTVDRVIEFDAEHARFFAGVVVWRPGELDRELKRGAWYVLEPEPELVLPHKTDGIWQQLVQRAAMRENGI